MHGKYHGYSLPVPAISLIFCQKNILPVILFTTHNFLLFQICEDYWWQISFVRMQTLYFCQVPCLPHFQNGGFYLRTFLDITKILLTQIDFLPLSEKLLLTFEQLIKRFHPFHRVLPNFFIDINL